MATAPLSTMLFFSVLPIPVLSPTPNCEPITGVIPLEKPISVIMNRLISPFTNDAAARSFTPYHPIIMLSAKLRITVHACPSIIGTPIFSISLTFPIRLKMSSIVCCFRPGSSSLKKPRSVCSEAKTAR